MRVLVTGGAGYIGALTVEELLLKDYKPVVFDSFYWGKDALEPYMERIEVIEGDCRNSKDIIYALEGIDAVIHLAGIVGEFACSSNQKAHHTINVESTRTLVNCCTDPEFDLVRDFIFMLEEIILYMLCRWFKVIRKIPKSKKIEKLFFYLHMQQELVL
jgi:nucleoside-diphosphate-sugar epimerase